MTPFIGQLSQHMLVCWYSTCHNQVTFECSYKCPFPSLHHTLTSRMPVSVPEGRQFSKYSHSQQRPYYPVLLRTYVALFETVNSVPEGRNVRCLCAHNSQTCLFKCALLAVQLWSFHHSLCHSQCLRNSLLRLHGAENPCTLVLQEELRRNCSMLNR